MAVVGLLHPAGLGHVRALSTQGPSLLVRAIAYATMLAHGATPATASFALASSLAALATAPIPIVWAQDPGMTFEEAAAAGEALGRATLPGPRTDGDNMYFVSEAGLETMSAVELFGGMTMSPDVATLEGLTGDDAATDAFVGTARTRIQAEDSALGDATRTATEAARARSHPNMAGDPAFANAGAIFDGSDPVFSTFFSGCTEVEVPTTAGGTAHIPEYEYCSRVVVPIETCEFRHDYQVALMSLSGGGASSSSCGPGCIDVEIGDETDNSWTAVGGCSKRSLSVSFNVENAAAIDSVTIAEVVWDDYAEIRVSGDPDPVWGGAPADTTNCEGDESYSATPGTNIASHFSENGNVTLDMNVWVGGHGEGYARFRINYNTSKVVVLDQWSITPECMGLAHGLNDGACRPESIACSEGPSHDIPCIMVGDIELCRSHLSPSPIHNGYSNLCRVGQVSADCRFYVGDLLCFTDPQGTVHCPTNPGGAENGCLDQEGRTECGHVGSTCTVPGAGGRCYAWEETWDCGYDVATPGGSTRTIACDGPIRCMGDECVTASAEASADFVLAATQLEAAQYGAMDFDCLGSDPSTCTIFSGQAYECKTALGGVLEQDCCSQPDGVDLGDYLKLTKSTWDLAKRLDQAEKLGSVGSNVIGAWDGLRSGASATFAKVTEPITSAWGSMTQNWGGAGGIENIQGLGIDQLKSQTTHQIGRFVHNTFGETVGDMFFEQTLGGQYTIGGALGTALSFVMLAYTIYVVVKLLIQIIWECEEAELELGVKRQLRSCNFIGTYCATSSFFGCIEERRSFCCYNSPLSRIVTEQAMPQLGQTFGTPDAPDCTGLSVADLQNLDWSRIDLSEWTGMLFDADLVPNTLGEADVRYSMGNATASPYDAAGPNARERVEDRVDAMDPEAARNEVRNNLWRGVN